MNSSRRSFLQLSSAAALSRIYPHFGNSGSADAALCRKLESDPLRPQYHLLPAHNWMNDPNGPIFFGGRYHMFHQYNPQAAVWGNMNWAHAISPDLVHWHHEPIAISPTPGGPDRDGVFSGSAVFDNGKPTVIYTGVAPPASEAEATLRDGTHTWRESQCLAVAEDDDLRIWKKASAPVIAAPPSGLDVTGFRDPFVWREGNNWMLILGSGFRGKGGAILLYSSPDLHRWTYLHPLVEGSPSGKDTVNPVDTGDMWECPDFFPLGNKHVLLISTMGKVHWKVGTYANQRFTSEKDGVADWGSYYAAKTMLDRDGNRILWGWIPETRADSELIAAGWAGAMSLPRVLSLSADDELLMEIAPAIEQLRAVHSKVTGTTVRPAQQPTVLNVSTIENLAAELILQSPQANNFTLRLNSRSGQNFVTIACSSNSHGRELQVNTVKGEIPGAAGSPLNLRAFLDGSVLEVFVNKTTALTARIYQIPTGPLSVTLEGDVNLTSLDLWQMNPISKDRLTSPLCS